VRFIARSIAGLGKNKIQTKTRKKKEIGKAPHPTDRQQPRCHISFSNFFLYSFFNPGATRSA
jgi:hypothetical protein